MPPPDDIRTRLRRSLGDALKARDASTVAELLARAGLAVRARLLREPDQEGTFTERTPQAFVLARKPVTDPAAPQ